MSVVVESADLEIVEADLDNTDHQQAVVHLLNAYAQEPIIGGKPLPDHVQSELIAGLQQHPTTVILLGFKQTEAVGIAVCFRGFSTFAAKPLLNIHDLAVRNDCQGQGLGQKLLAAVEAKARQLDCCKVTLEVYDDNDFARRAYRKAGFEPSEEGPDTRRTLFLWKKLASS